MKVSFALSFLLFSMTAPTSWARSGGAPICPANEPAPPNGPHGNSSGDLAAGGVTVTIDGTELTAGGSLPELSVGTPVTVTVASASSFRGILVRIPGATIDIPSGGFREGSGCPDGVGSITHTSNAGKTEVTFTLTMDEEAASAGLDVNILRSFNEHYYEQFPLSAVDDSTAAPTSSTQAPTSSTSSPTSTPSAAVAITKNNFLAVGMFSTIVMMVATILA